MKIYTYIPITFVFLDTLFFRLSYSKKLEHLNVSNKYETFGKYLQDPKYVLSDKNVTKDLIKGIFELWDGRVE